MREEDKSIGNQPQFYWLKLAKKIDLTKDSFLIGFAIPTELKLDFSYQPGQYIGLKFRSKGVDVINDYSIVSSPKSETLDVVVKKNSSKSSTNELYLHYDIGDSIEVGLPQGRFVSLIKPHEKRTILAFAGGIGITPIYSQIVHLLEKENRTRVFLFYSNKTEENVVLREEIDLLESNYPNRFFVYYFFTQQEMKNPLMQGRLDEKKVNLIINQLLHLDEDDDESTIWDSTDKVLICGPGGMVKSIANACYNKGIPKRDIHFELFEAFNDDIYPLEEPEVIIQKINVKLTYKGKVNNNIILKDNKGKILQQLLELGIDVPYSCKSGVCGSCMCRLENGLVEMEENEYLTDREVSESKILPCSAIAMSQDISLNFDAID